MPVQLGLFGESMPMSPCSIAQAMSSLVKCVRLRRTEDAIYWYTHILHCFPDQHYRLDRRVLIMAAEDCIEAPIQSTAYDWFKGVAHVNSMDRHGITCYLLSMMCSTDNWWKQPTGQKYILGWRMAEKANRLNEDQNFTKDSEWGRLTSAVVAKDTPTALQSHMRLMKLGYAKNKYAQWLLETSTASFNLPARMVSQCTVVNAKALGFDDNWLGQALWRVLGNDLGNGVYSEPSSTHIDHVRSKCVSEVYSKPRTPPAWALDGIHCSGKDRRFAGIISSMVGCCNAYNKWGTLDPHHEWDSSTYSSDVLRKSLYV